MITDLELFKEIFKINLITFGGGYTIAPVLLDTFSRKRKLIKEEEMLDIIALGQSGPGALAVSCSLLTGYKIKGIKGAALAAIASILPPLIIISIIFYFYKEVATNYWVRAALRGMSGIICAVLLITTFRLGKVALKKHPVFSAIIMLTSFIFGYFTSINTGIIILALAILGLVVFSLKGVKIP